MKWIRSAWLCKMVEFLSVFAISEQTTVIHIPFWFNTDSIMPLFSFSPTFFGEGF